ncbi:MAG: class I SAM-dependent methyltransferase [Terracidiphilus sp.]
MLRRWFEKKQEAAASPGSAGLTGPRVPRHSGAWSVLRKRLQSEPGLCIIDTGYTSPANINYLTSLGHSVFLADLVSDAYTGDWRAGSDEDGKPIWNVAGFLDHSLNFSGRMFDVVLLWTVLDFLPEPILAPLVARLFAAMNPGGQVLAFFHTRTHGEEVVRYRYHVTPGDDVDMQMTQQFPIQRAFTNRSIERLFTGWSGHRQFLAKDSVSEVIITR